MPRQNHRAAADAGSVLPTCAASVEEPVLAFADISGSRPAATVHADVDALQLAPSRLLSFYASPSAWFAASSLESRQPRTSRRPSSS
eukprot:CAMPEP_0181433388 /NCGR_PEP_ID=MMETSP1110-20121109/19265_1 /TAXON_ID=174948 /ORGANISM="Symbiodinium sp., Strain CCMP421" /LENGTH=86 /DNA_ID=CAMNT_0023556837 /DNA_START=30 /DNA_END=287 /DNA_ORIENTATION=-